MTGCVDTLDRGVAETRVGVSVRLADRPRTEISANVLKVCKLCKCLVPEDEGGFFVNAQTGALIDFQCRWCTQWELAPEGQPGNIRTDLVHHD